VSRKEFDKRINSDEIAGRAIRLCAIFEDRLNNVLAEYFALHDRWGDFHEHFLERMSRRLHSAPATASPLRII